MKTFVRMRCDEVNRMIGVEKVTLQRCLTLVSGFEYEQTRPKPVKNEKDTFEQLFFPIGR